MRCALLLGVACAGWISGTWGVEAMVAGPIQSLQSKDEQTRLKAIDTLANEGVRNPAAVPALVEQLADASAKVRVHAADALGQIGSPARAAGPALGTLLDDANVHVRRAAVRALRRIRPDPQVSVPFLMKVMEDPDPAVRVGALDALAESGKEAVGPLVATLKKGKTAYWACLALGELGGDAAAAVPALGELLQKDPRPEVRREAALTLGSIGAKSAPAVPQLAAALNDSDAGIALAAVFALGRIGPAAKPAEQALEKLAAAHASPLGRTLTLWARARVNPHDAQLFRQVVPLLAEGMRSNEPRLRVTAVRALVDLHSMPDLVLPAMQKILRQGDPAAIQGAVEVLASLGEPGVPLLVESLARKDVRLRVVSLLGAMGETAQSAVPDLIELVRDRDPAIRREALLSLGAIGPAAQAAVPAAMQAMQDGNSQVRYGACYALGRMGNAALDAKPALQQEMENADPFLSLVCAWALARIDPDCSQVAAKSIPLLVRALADAEPMVRLEAAASLRCLGPQARVAADTLRRVAKEDPQELVRDMATEALRAAEN
jgi:HEAT repeat protein